jgi:hypothetical protein
MAIEPRRILSPFASGLQLRSELLCRTTPRLTPRIENRAELPQVSAALSCPASAGLFHEEGLAAASLATTTRPRPRPWGLGRIAAADGEAITRPAIDARPFRGTRHVIELALWRQPLVNPRLGNLFALGARPLCPLNGCPHQEPPRAGATPSAALSLAAGAGAARFGRLSPSDRQQDWRPAARRMARGRDPRRSLWRRAG